MFSQFELTESNRNEDLILSLLANAVLIVAARCVLAPIDSNSLAHTLTKTATLRRADLSVIRLKFRAQLKG